MMPTTATIYLRPDQLERGVTSVGDAQRLRRRLIRREPLTLVAIGASTVVRGGCHRWQRSKCSADRYATGWLMRAFDMINESWPNPHHKLINHAHMAVGPSYFAQCTNLYVPHDADLVLLGFADMCGHRPGFEKASGTAGSQTTPRTS